jgi:hypothetical protein
LKAALTSKKATSPTSIASMLLNPPARAAEIVHAAVVVVPVAVEVAADVVAAVVTVVAEAVVATEVMVAGTEDTAVAAEVATNELT